MGKDSDTGARLALAFTSSLLIYLTVAVTAWASDTPEITSPVTDRADVISAPVEAALGDELRAHFEQTGVQMAVLTVSTTDSEPIEDFSFRVADEWGGGNAGQDRGILLTLSIDDRRSRLEVGYGLEAVYSDVRASRLLRRIRPSLRAQDYDSAVQTVVDEVIEGTDHLQAGRRPGILDIHPLWNGAIGMLLMTLFGLVVVGVPAVLGAEEWVSWSTTQTTWICFAVGIIGAALAYWLALGIAPWGYLAMFVGGALGGMVLGAAEGMRRFAPIPAFFAILCFVAAVPSFNGGLPHDPDGQMLFFAIAYASAATIPYISTFDTRPYGRGGSRRGDDGGFSSGGSSSSSGGGGYSGGGGSFGGGGASGGW
ncbi:MAG: TPM domain-containing protein [Myxococcota bacterium]